MTLLVLMAGLHLSFDSHFCGGKLYAVKFSITGEKASCGMEEESEALLPGVKLFKTHCCDNDLVSLTVDSNYSPSSFQSNDLTQKVEHLFAVSVSESFPDFHPAAYYNPVLSPPAFFQKKSVELAAICVFRI